MQCGFPLTHFFIKGPVASALTNRFGHRAVIIAGSGLGCAGLVYSSFTLSIANLFITLGVICGIAFGLVFTPSVVGVVLYFDKRQALATGIALCGTGIGTCVMAPLTIWLLDTYSLRVTFLILVLKLKKKFYASLFHIFL